MIFCDDAISMTTAREPGGSRRKTKEENYHYYLLENIHLKMKYVYTDIEEKERFQYTFHVHECDKLQQTRHQQFQ